MSEISFFSSVSRTIWEILMSFLLALLRLLGGDPKKYFLKTYIIMM